jgi:hypothetical protein
MVENGQKDRMWQSCMVLLLPTTSLQKVKW